MHSGTEGFLMPIFKKIGGDATIYVQIPDYYSNRVENFKEILIGKKEYGNYNYNTKFLHGVGEPQIYAFLDRNGALFVGSGVDFKDRLDKYPEECSDYFHSAASKIIRKREIIGIVRNKEIESCKISNISKKYYELSMFINSIWDGIVCATKPERYLEVEKFRNQILIEASRNNKKYLPKDLWDKIADNLYESVEEICQKIQNELPGEPSDGIVEVYDLQIPKLEESLFLSHLRRLKGLRRQEQRLAYLLDVFIEDQNSLNNIIGRYKDRGKVAQKYIEFMKQCRDNDDRTDRMHIVASLIHGILADSFTFGRGITLFHLAEYLGHHPPVAEAILTRLKSSNDQSIWRIEQSILPLLIKSEGT